MPDVSQSIYRSIDGERRVKEGYRDLLAHWPIANESRTVSTQQGETHVVICGIKSAPPLVLLHGSAANAAVWMFDMPMWAEHFRIYAVDMIGEAGLSAPVRPPLASDAHARWLDEVLGALGLSRISIVGESLGGWLALDYATRNPERIERLALLAPAGIGRQKNFLLSTLPLLFLGEWGARLIRERIFGPPPVNVTPEGRRFAEFLQLVLDNFRPRIVQIPVLDDAALRRLAMPVLIMLGGKDVLLDSLDTQRRAEHNISEAIVHLDPEGFHLIRNRAKPILDFLRGSITTAADR